MEIEKKDWPSGCQLACRNPSGVPCKLPRQTEETQLASVVCDGATESSQKEDSWGRECGQSCSQGKHLVTVTPGNLHSLLPQSVACLGMSGRQSKEPSYLKKLFQWEMGPFELSYLICCSVWEHSWLAHGWMSVSISPVCFQSTWRWKWKGF